MEVDQSIGQTRFHWLRSAPEARGASNLVGLTERIVFLRTLEIDPKLKMRILCGRWDQMIREGNATPTWLASDFNSSRRHALIVAQVIKLGQKLTDDAVTTFIKLMGRLFSRANNRKKQRHMECRPDTAKALRMFLDTITALQSANDYGRNAMEVLDQKVGWHRLLRMKPELESMVEGKEASPLALAAEQYATVNKYAGAFLQAFTFQSARRHDPLLAAISLLKRLHAEKRRALPDRVPVTHLSQADRRLIFEHGKPDRLLYEIATLAALRDRLRSADIWVDGSRSFRPMDEHLMPPSTFTTMKEEDRLGLGVQGDGAAWLVEARQILDFNLKRLAHRARSGKLEGVRLEAGALIVAPTAGEVPAAAEDARVWGNGTTSSSDGQFFRASDRAAKRGDVNLHYGSEPGSKFYSHLSDQYCYFSILPINPTESEAAYVLDGLFDQDTVLDIQERFTDTGGASDHIFGLFALIGKRFAPRLRNLKDRKFHTFEKGDAYPAPWNHIGTPINTALILEHWDDLLPSGGVDHDAISGAVYDPQVAVRISERKPARKGAARTRPHRALALHDRVVLKSSAPPALPSRPQQG